MIAPPGFQPLLPNKPIRIHRRNLPHWRQDGATYFVTFHLGDSLPVEALRELRELRNRISNCKTDGSAQAKDLIRKVHQRTTKWLEAGHGSCLLAHLEYRSILYQALLHFHGQRVDLGALIIMPNHVHLLARPLESIELSKWLQSVKTFSSKNINEARNTAGSIWFIESHDRIVRDVDHLNRCVRYIGRNGLKAGIQHASHTQWLNEDWQHLGYAFPK